VTIDGAGSAEENGVESSSATLPATSLRSARRQSAYLAWGALTVAGLLYGYNWVVMKTALKYADPASFAALRVFLGAVFLFAVVVLLRRPLLPTNWLLTALVGLFGMTGSTGLTIWALESGGAGKTSVVVYTMPVWLLLMSWSILGERLHGIQWLLVLATLTGLLFVIAPWKTHGTLLSSFLAIGAGVCSAAASITVKVLSRDRRVDLLTLTAWQMLLGSLPLILIAFLTADSGPRWTGWFSAALLYNAVFASAVAALLWFYTLRHLPAGTAGLGRLLAPVVGVGASWIQLGERPDRYEAVGMVLILLGLAALAGQQIMRERRAASLREPAAIVADQPPGD